MITGHKDADRLILEKMDDETLMNTMASNKYLLKIGEEIFKNRLRNKYPYLYENKPFLENYRSYYLKMMYYLGKLKEEFNVTYIPVKSFDPEALYRGLTILKRSEKHVDEEEFNTYRTLPYLARYYGELGNENEIRNYINLIHPHMLHETQSKILDNLLKYSAKSNIDESQNDLLKYSAKPNIDESQSDSFKYKHISLFEKLSEEWNMEFSPDRLPMFTDAAESGDINIINYLLDKLKGFNLEEDEQFDIYYYGVKGAARIGNVEIIDYMIKLYPWVRKDLDPHRILFHAMKTGQVEFIKHLLNDENRGWLMDSIPILIDDVFINDTDKETAFLPERKVKEMLNVILDYYKKEGGTRDKFFKKIRINENKFYKQLYDNDIAIFIKMKLAR